MRKWLIAGAALIVGIQMVPIDRSNPPVQQSVDAPGPVKAILERSCFDCHSHETRWPWYSHIAPVSWLVGYDVAEAREHMNLSTWNLLDPEERAETIEEIWEEVEEGEMPLWYYLPLHPEARLSEADRTTLRDWAAAEGDGSDADSDSHSHSH